MMRVCIHICCCAQDSILPDIVLPLISIVSSPAHVFPGGSVARRAICFKLIDSLYVISVRIGREMTRQRMTFALQRFFAVFNVHATADEASKESQQRGDVPG